MLCQQRCREFRTRRFAAATGDSHACFSTAKGSSGPAPLLALRSAQAQVGPEMGGGLSRHKINRLQPRCTRRFDRGTRGPRGLGAPFFCAHGTCMHRFWPVSYATPFDGRPSRGGALKRSEDAQGPSLCQERIAAHT